MAKILLIEDNDLVRGMLAETLTQIDYEVIEAPTADGGLKQVKASPPDLIILDLYLEGSPMNGLETLAIIRSIKSLEKTPVVIISGHATDNDLSKAIKFGIGAFFPKPFKPTRLIETIEQLLNPGTAQPDDIE